MGGYKGLHEYEHQIIDHAVQYVDGRIHMNGLENFWSLLKRGLGGTYVAVEPPHLFCYLDEQVSRYNSRKTKEHNMTDADRFSLAVSNIIGKRLTFAALTGKDGKALVEEAREAKVFVNRKGPIRGRAFSCRINSCLHKNWRSGRRLRNKVYQGSTRLQSG